MGTSLPPQCTSGSAHLGAFTAFPMATRQRPYVVASLVYSCYCLAYLAWLLTLSAAADTPVTEAQVLVEELPNRFQHAESEGDLQLLYSTSLFHDFAVHSGRQYQLADLARTAKQQCRVRFYKHISIVVIRNSTLHVATLSPSGKPPSPTPRRVAAIREGLHNATLHGVTLPDCVFLLNTWDEPKCPIARPELCPGPVLSLIKTWDATQGASMHSDILVPFFNHVYQMVHEYPWNLKQRKALMRAAIQGGMPPNNTRMALVRLSQQESLAKLIDAGITNNQKPGLKVQVVPPISMADHAKWRYLVSADGYTASCRLGKILGINSVVLKEQSRWVEYWYRALQPRIHYVPFTHASIMQVLEQLDTQSDEQLEAISKAAQAFQQMYLTQFAKAMYMRRVLQQYVQLFPAGVHASFVAQLDTTRLYDVLYLQEQLLASGSSSAINDSIITSSRSMAPAVAHSSSRTRTNHRRARVPSTAASAGNVISSVGNAGESTGIYTSSIEAGGGAFNAGEGKASMGGSGSSSSANSHYGEERHLSNPIQASGNALHTGSSGSHTGGGRDGPADHTKVSSAHNTAAASSTQTDRGNDSSSGNTAMLAAAILA